MGSKESTDLVTLKFDKEMWQRGALVSLLKRGARLLVVALLAVVVAVIAIDRWISWRAKDQLFTDISEIDNVQVAVVLGTSKYLGRTLNEYYTHRINAAIELYDEGKVSHFLLSGDNAHRSYNEPWTMKRDLLRASVPEPAIHLDYAGFRTLDSIVRAKEIFDTDNFLIITQKFHCERALFIAQYYDINAQCLAVAGPVSKSGYSVRLREVFARTKALLDLYVMHTQPRFLGPKEPIVTDSKIGSEIAEAENAPNQDSDEPLEQDIEP